jgi:hypothetical protein
MKTLILISCVIFSSIGFAEQKGGAPPRPDFTKLAFLTASGPSWRCEAHVTPLPGMGKPHKIVASVSVSDVLGGSWRGMHYAEKKTAENPMPLSIEEMYTGAGDRFIRYAFDSFGGSMRGVGTVEDERIVFDSEATVGPAKMPARISFGKRASDMAVALEFQTPDGQWLRVWDGACKR